ncbi:VOC family protein [Methylobacterium aquaticum]|uniref:VOC family protein n=1 Tax=Methylobacterium aquaticum TaxID=270351 RepID=UPI0032B30679
MDGRNGLRVSRPSDGCACAHGIRVAGGADGRAVGVPGSRLSGRTGQAYDPGFAHPATVADDIDALLARLAGYGWKAQGVPQTVGGGARSGTRLIFVVGPDGATVEFMQPRPPMATFDPTCEEVGSRARVASGNGWGPAASTKSLTLPYVCTGR